MSDTDLMSEALASLASTTTPPTPEPVAAAPAAPEPTPEAAPAPTPVSEPTAAVRGLAELMGRQNLFEEYRKKVVPEADQKLAEYEALRGKLSTPEGLLEVATRAGLDPKAVVQKAAEVTRSADPLDPVKSELEQVKAELALIQKQRQEELAKQAVENARTAAIGFVRQKKEDFPLTNALGYEPLVFDTIHTYMNQTGQALSEADAAAKVESELASLVGKVKSYLSVTNTPPAETPKQPVTAPTSKPAPVITNQTASQIASNRGVPVILDPNEAFAQALAALGND